MKPFHFALILLGVCLIAIWQVSIIPESTIQMAVGPVFAPAFVVGVLTLLSIAYAVSAYQGHQPDETLNSEQSPLEGSRARLCVMLLGVLLFTLTVGKLGFIPASTLCAMCVASCFRDHKALLQAWLTFIKSPNNHWRTLLRACVHDQRKVFFMCAAISISFWFIFVKLLGVNLGMALIFLN